MTDLHEVYENVAKVWNRDYNIHISPGYMMGYKQSDWALLDNLPLQEMKALNIGASYPIDAINIGWKFKQFYETDFTKEIVDKMRSTFEKVYPKTFYSNIYFEVVDATKILFEDNFFDIVIAYSSLDHIPEHDKAIDEMCRVSKKYVCITLPNLLDEFNANYSKEHPERFGYEKYWSIPKLLHKMMKQGFIPIKYNNNEGHISGNRFGYLFERYPGGIEN